MLHKAPQDMKCKSCSVLLITSEYCCNRSGNNTDDFLVFWLRSSNTALLGGMGSSVSPPSEWACALLDIINRQQIMQNKRIYCERRKWANLDFSVPRKNISSLCCVAIGFELADTRASLPLRWTHNLFTSTRAWPRCDLQRCSRYCLIGSICKCCRYIAPTSQSWSLPAMNLTVIWSLSHTVRRTPTTPQVPVLASHFYLFILIFVSLRCRS